jgi:carbonic anhydrase/acetyltransferase-like protein (isoleucine patch superfamily)
MITQISSQPSVFIKRRMEWIRLFSGGEGARILFNRKVDGSAMTKIRAFGGQQPRIASDAWIDETAVVIGAVSLESGASIWPLCVVRGDIHRIEIGAGTNIQDGSVLHVSRDSRFMPGGAPLMIHERVTVGHQVVLHGCEIQDHCLVGVGARVLDRAILQPRTLLGAGSLVAPGQVLEGGYLWLGTPARRVRPLTDQELEYLDDVAENYVRLAARHRAEQGAHDQPPPPAVGR